MPSLRDRLFGPKQLAVSDSVKVPLGKGYSIIINKRNKLPGMFGRYDRDMKALNLLETIYLQGGLASHCVDAYPYYILSNGHRLEGEDKASLKKVEDFFQRNDMNRILRNYITDSCTFGRPYTEIIYGTGAMAKVPVGVKPLPPKTIKVETDERGNIVGYTQIIDQGMSKYIEIKFPLENMLSEPLFPCTGQLYGTSLIARSLSDITHDDKIAEATAQAILRHGFPKYQIKLGVKGKGETIDPKIMNGVDQELRGLEAQNEITTPADVEIINLDADVLPNIKDIMEWSTSRLCISMGIPEVVMGLGRGATEASSYTEMQCFYDKISMLQKDLARIFNFNLIDKITGKPGSVSIVFNDANPVDEDQIATYIAKIMQQTPMQPFSVFPRKWIQKKFGIDEDAYLDKDNDLLGDDTPSPEEKDAYYQAINAPRQNLPNPKDQASNVTKPNAPNDNKTDAK